MSDKLLNGFNDGLHASSGIGGRPGPFDILKPSTHKTLDELDAQYHDPGDMEKYREAGFGLIQVISMYIDQQITSSKARELCRAVVNDAVKKKWGR